MKRIKELFIIFTCLLVWAVLLGGWTYTYDTATPLGSDAPSVIDDRIREVKAAIQERMNVDHYWPLTGTEVSDAAAGQHRQIEFYGPISTPTYAANKMWIYGKDVSSVIEAHILDESNNEIQLTSGGTINITSADLLGTLASDTYFTDANSVDLIKGDPNGDAMLPDGAELATSAAPTTDHAIANKKYADDIIANHVILTEEKAQGSHGGTFTSGDWRKRTVTEKSDTQSLSSVSSSVITLSAGTYLCQISCPAFRVNGHQARLQNTTGASTLVLGTTGYNGTGDATNTRSFIVGIFTVAASQNLEIQHICGSTYATSGFGLAANLGTEVYTVAHFWKIG